MRIRRFRNAPRRSQATRDSGNRSRNSELVKEYSDHFGPRPGWLFLTGEPTNIEGIVRRLGHTSSDPRAHTTFLIVGNVAKAKWTKLKSTASEAEIAETLRFLADDRRIVSVRRYHLLAAIGLAVGGMLTSVWAGDFTREEHRGKQLYREGVEADGTSPMATICHGSLIQTPHAGE
jgi:hypothetical protein